MGGLVVALYGLSFAAHMWPIKLAPVVYQIITVGLYSAIAGAISLLLGLYTFFATHPEDINENSRLNYIIVLITIVILITQTGTASSPFALLWGGIALVAPVFGGWGVVPALLIAIGTGAFGYFTGQFGVAQAGAIAGLASVPVLLGFTVKPAANPDSADTKEDRSYSALARELGQISNKSEVVINAIGEGVLAVNGQGVIELINPAATQLVGWGKSDAIGLNYKSILKLVDSKGTEIDSAHDPVASTFSNNSATGPGEFTLVTQSDKKIMVSVLVSPIGQPGSGAIVVFRNISSERAEERQQAEFISTASHEMRTPVASIEGYLGLALNPNTAQIDDKARDFITKAHEAAQHLGRLFQDLLDVSKAEDGRMQSDPKIVDVVKFVGDIAEGLRPKAEQKGLKLIFKPQVGAMGDFREHGIGRTVVPSFYSNVDNDHLREVADNLIENAIKYTPSGEVVIDITGTDQNITISVTDTGLGIPREDIPHLFQKFYRVDNSETREIGGTGLGLYLCRRLVEAMNGRIWVESTYQKGSTFYVELPRTSSIEASTIIQQVEHESEQTPVAQPISILPPDQLVDTIAQAAPALAPPSTPPVAPLAPPSAPVIQAPPAATPTVADIPGTATVQPQYPHPIQDFPNTNLSEIEKDPARYIAETEGRALNIPPRQP